MLTQRRSTSTAVTQAAEPLPGWLSRLLLQDSIKTGKEWFMASIAYAPGLAACMARHQASLPGYEAQLHLLYLANDVLLKRCAFRHRRP